MRHCARLCQLNIEPKFQNERYELNFAYIIQTTYSIIHRGWFCVCVCVYCSSYVGKGLFNGFLQYTQNLVRIATHTPPIIISNSIGFFFFLSFVLVVALWGEPIESPNRWTLWHFNKLSNHIYFFFLVGPVRYTPNTQHSDTQSERERE